jgi:putative AlgH/UPF0301 family transcriptional regulator
MLQVSPMSGVDLGSIPGVGDWLQAELDPELLFDVPVAQRWDEVWARLGVNPFGFMAVRGGAQA